MTPGRSVNPSLPAFWTKLRERESQMIEDLRVLVELESPSMTKASVDLLGNEIAARFERMGGKVRFHSQVKFGDHLQVDFKGSGSGKPVLLLGHFDTVWELGTLVTMPFRIEDGILYGPGVLDMKAGIVMAMHAIQVLQQCGAIIPDLICLWVTDEEVGSETSRGLTERIAKDCAAVLVLEPAQMPGGRVKTARKGVGEFTLRVTGKAAHSGVDFEKGHSAILELARQILAVSMFVEPDRGITVNPGVIRGGTRSNVIAAHAECDVDLRIARLEDASYLENKFKQLRPFDSACRLDVAGGINRPPMERTAGVAHLYGIARELAGELDLDLGEASTGGGSDGNFTAALGIPTLDGLGGVGEGAHARHEHIHVAELSRRTALLAGLILQLGNSTFVGTKAC